jgi:Fic family protein
MLIPLILYEKGLISSPTFYISEYFEENRPAYYDHLGAISRKGDWQGWVDFFLTAVVEQAGLNTHRASAILSLYNRMKDEINSVTRSQYALKTLDALFAAPFATTSEFVKISGIPRRTAERIFESLVENQTFRQVEPPAGRRPGVYVFDQLIEITERRRFV